MIDAKKILDMLMAGAGNTAGSDDLRKRAGEALADTSRSASDTARQAASAVSGVLGKAEEKLKGTGAEGYVSQAKRMVDENPVAAVTALGGLAALLLGTKGGREVAGSAVKLGGLAAIGGLAWKAMRNYQEGKALTSGVPGLDQLTGPPQGSGYEPETHTDATALLMVRAMIACAAADGVVDPGERELILGDMAKAGLGEDDVGFLEREIARPASVEELARGAGGSGPLAVQVYAAAYLVASSALERAWLDDLGRALKLDPALTRQVGALVSEARGRQPV
jgi:uncharacterized membrane protein YebE (DUF533 family)